MRKIIPYNSELKELAKELRNKSTKSEILLWQKLKGKQLYGYQFSRQKPLLKYIVDFYCYDLNLVIELDGYSHQLDEVFEKDKQKTLDLEKQGLKILRFQDKDVFDDMENVILVIENYILEFEGGGDVEVDLEKHTPSPSQEGN
ncbi:endonuclease domain-containing protein [Aureivirga sp. CE67]|uniref:endonuclease domain-containing protein n=1 Tax=Aureivirga sp. CE67 TaxID=1788983 RepID=UPI0018C9176E|nr:endonuclease domain-containing protein [Aureivirga sp. CE67]